MHAFTVLQLESDCNFAELFKESAAAMNININERKSENSLTLQDKMLRIDSEIKKKLQF